MQFKSLFAMISNSYALISYIILRYAVQKFICNDIKQLCINIVYYITIAQILHTLQIDAKHCIVHKTRYDKTDYLCSENNSSMHCA